MTSSDWIVIVLSFIGWSFTTTGDGLGDGAAVDVADGLGDCNAVEPEDPVFSFKISPSLPKAKISSSLKPETTFR